MFTDPEGKETRHFERVCPSLIQFNYSWATLDLTAFSSMKVFFIKNKRSGKDKFNHEVRVLESYFNGLIFYCLNFILIFNEINLFFSPQHLQKFY